MLQKILGRVTAPPSPTATTVTLPPTSPTPAGSSMSPPALTATRTIDRSDDAPARKRPPRRRRKPNRSADTAGAQQSERRDTTANGRKPRTARAVELQAGPLERDRTFGSIAISEPIRLALNDMGYENPTPIQEQAIPNMLQGRDVVGRAQTGTGKTAAFGIPMIELLDPTRAEVQGIVLAPTRELAVQVTGELRRLAEYRGIKAVTLYGGQKIEIQFRALQNTPQIIVGTPGRVQDHMKRGTLRLNNVRIAVLDEADQMLDIGFAEDMIRILRATPNSRQTSLYSATVPTFIKRMIEKFLRDPLHIGIGTESEAADTIEQVYYEVAAQDKLAGIEEILRNELRDEKTLIFCRTQVGVDRLVRRLQRGRLPVQPIHGGMRQGQRESVMRAFKSGDLKILVATNVASRGIDVPEISHVINYDMPGNLEEYIHRIGRTGRIGNAGKAVTFVGEDDFQMLQIIRRHVGDVLSKGRLAIYA